MLLLKTNLLYYLISAILCYYIVLDVLKRNYTKLYKNLPNDYKKTISTIPQYLIGASLKGLLQLKFEHIDEMNAAIICRLLLYIMKDEDVLKICDVLDCLNDDVSSKQVIEVFRNGKQACNL